MGRAGTDATGTPARLAPSRPGGYLRRMERPVVYHNPVCGKSRGALDILRERGVDAEVIEYLKTPLDGVPLERVLALLGGPPADLVRKDKRFAELGLRAQDYTTREQVVTLLLAHPELIERPVVIRDGRALIARPSERVLELLDEG
jgi:arsenate reductase (glutaredoxin)